MVCRRRNPRAAADAGGPRRAHQHRPQDVGKDLLQLDGKYPALVRLAAALVGAPDSGLVCRRRSEEHTSELQSLMRISYAVFCLKKKTVLSMIQNANMAIKNDKNS